MKHDEIWDGKISNLKISSLSYPELHLELSKMNHKERCDRLRSLAFIGLLSLKNGIGLSALHQVADDSVIDINTANKIDESRASLKGKLLQTV